MTGRQEAWRGVTWQRYSFFSPLRSKVNADKVGFRRGLESSLEGVSINPFGGKGRGVTWIDVNYLLDHGHWIESTTLMYEEFIESFGCVSIDLGQFGERKFRVRDISSWTGFRRFFFFLLTMVARVVIIRWIFCITSVRKKGSFCSRQKGEFILENNSWKQWPNFSTNTRNTFNLHLKQSLFLLSSVEWVQHKMAPVLFSLFIAGYQIFPRHQFLFCKR